jgi:cytochrome c oxidase subunit 1
MTIAAPKPDIVSVSLQPKGWLRYFSFSADHKVIGLQYPISCRGTPITRC